MIAQRTPARPLQSMLLLGLSALLAWLIVTRSFAAYLAHEAPGTALILNSSEAAALLNLADAKLNARAKEAHEPAALSGGTQERDEQVPERHSGDDRISGWAEVALKAAAARLPIDHGRSDSGAPALPLADADKAQIQAMVEAALLQDPLNARALRILGQLAVAEGDEARAAKLMRAAADRSLGESVAVFWMLHKSFELKDYAPTLSYADTFLRKRPQFMAHAVPLLAWMAESGNPEAVRALEATLAQKPPWRADFFRELPGRIGDARTPLNLLLSLKEADAPPTTNELKAYIRFLIQHKLYELAYYTWLQFLPAGELARIGYVANPSFENPPSGLPFDWEVAQGTGVTVDFVPRPGDAEGDALFIELGPGRADFRGVSQLVLLTPGSYKLKGRLKGESSGRRGLQWSVRCAGGSAPPLGEGPMFVGVAPKWTNFELTFSVPNAAECRAQELRLALAARSASEQLVSGSVWYDDLQISRADQPATEAANGPPE